MSKVYSFRLNVDNPREAQAREVIEAWVEDGYSLRHIITEALLISFDNKNGDEEVYALLEQIKRMISELENTASLDINDERKISGLSSSFKVAVKNSAKIGLRDQNKLTD
jgi:hypothetical protein